MHIVLADGTTVDWAFHVAAAFTDSEGTVWIIDPILAKSVITVTEWQKNIQQQNIDVQIEALATGPEIYNLVPEAEAEWQNVIANKPFSEAALDFITEAMADLFYWETFKD